MKSLLIIMLVIISSFTFSQSKVNIEKSVDDITGVVTYIPTYKLVIHDNDKIVGFTIQPYINPKLEFQSLIVMSYNIGNCVEKSKLIIRFTNNKSYTISSWNAFNCDHVSYFELNDEIRSSMISSKIDKIRFTNGYTYDEFTGYPAINEADYFAKIIKSVNRIKIFQ